MVMNEFQVVTYNSNTLQTRTIYTTACYNIHIPSPVTIHWDSLDNFIYRCKLGVSSMLPLISLALPLAIVCHDVFTQATWSDKLVGSLLMLISITLFMYYSVWVLLLVSYVTSYL